MHGVSSGMHIAYPHSPSDLPHEFPARVAAAFSSHVVPPLQPVYEVIRQDDFTLYVQRLFCVQQWVRARLQGDRHVERVLHNQRAVVKV